MFKPFYIHRNHVPGKMNSKFSRGFTLKVSPYPEDNKLALVQGTLCSPKDEFCRKDGRSQADGTKAEKINKRDIPRLLVQMSKSCGWDESTNDYNYVLKYFI